MNEVLSRILLNTANGIVRFFEWLIRLILSIPKWILYPLTELLKWVVSLRFWPLMSLIATIVVVIVVAVMGSFNGWWTVVAQWFRSEAGTQISMFVVLAILAFIYKTSPSLFSPILVACFSAVVLMFIFELHKSKLLREGQNHWAVFAIFILPLLPVMFTFFEYANKLVHAVLTVTYLVLVCTLMGTNPGKVFQPRLYTQGTILIVLLLIVVALVTVIFNKHILSEDWSKYLSRIGMMFVTLAALALAVTWAIKFFASPPAFSENGPRYVTMMLILVVAGAIAVSAIYKRIPHKSYFAYFSKANLAWKSLMLLSCWMADAAAVFSSEPMQTWLLLLIEVVLIVWYIYSKRVFTQTRENGAGGIFKPTGVMLRNEPISLKNTTVLPLSQKFKYNYAISCWVYLHAQPPSSSPEATGFSNIISYGGRPAVLFNAATNTLRVTMKHPGGKRQAGLSSAVKTLAEFTGESLPSEELSFDGPYDVLVADIPDVALQKWIHLVFFYNSTGTLDIFINGELYKSVATIITDESSGITLGANKGNSGRVANIMFFQSTKNAKDAFFLGGDAIDLSTVRTMYNDFKTRDPPVVRRMMPVQTSVFKEHANDAVNKVTDVGRKIEATGSRMENALRIRPPVSRSQPVAQREPDFQRRVFTTENSPYGTTLPIRMEGGTMETRKSGETITTERSPYDTTLPLNTDGGTFETRKAGGTITTA